MACSSHSHDKSKPNQHGYFKGENIPSYETILNCIRCGMCLPHCPTYNIMKVERASPRGRAALVRSVADGRLELTHNFADQVYLCLDCRACETACPSGVRIGYMIESARSQVEQNAQSNPFVKVLKNFLFGWLFHRHWRLEMAAFPLRIYQKSGLQNLLHKIGLFKILPKQLGFMEALSPRGLTVPFRHTLPELVPARGEEKARVGYFLGCMMSIMFNKTTNATVNILNRSNCTVVTSKDIRCCGAPLLTEGYKHKALDLMRHNVDLFEKMNVDYIVTDCAACAASCKEYGEFLEDDPDYREKAKSFSSKVREINEFLADWPHTAKAEKSPFDKPVKALYDEPCHLCHAQGIWEQPKKMIRSVPDVELVDLPEADWCCGSAGVYNVTHYDMSMKILDRKMDNVEQVEADILLTANPGCLLQLAYGVQQRKLPLKVMHIVELLDDGTGYGEDKNK